MINNLTQRHLVTSLKNHSNFCVIISFSFLCVCFLEKKKKKGLMTGRDQADCVQLMRMPHCFYRTRHLFGLNPPSLYGSHRTMIKLLTFELPITIKCAHTNKKKSRLAALAPYPELKFHCMCIAKKGR